jgi:hypothetical protein
MEFTAPSILFSVFAALIAAFGAGLTSYMTSKAAVRAATEDITKVLEKLREETKVVEATKQEIAIAAALQTDLIRAVYGWMAAAQSLLHSMCWLAWDAKERGTASAALCSSYNMETHKLIPELLAQSATIRLIRMRCYSALEAHLNELFKLDAEFGKTILLAETDARGAAAIFGRLYLRSSDLTYRIATKSGVELLETKAGL